jgi:hypothetical protein
VGTKLVLPGPVDRVHYAAFGKPGMRGRKERRMSGRSGFYLVLAAGALANGGCLAAAVGAVGAAGVGYAYYQGEDHRDFYAGPEETRAAVRSALAALKIPVVNEERGAASNSLEALTAEGDRVQVSLDRVPDQPPGESPRTRLSVRVGTFGDHSLSERLLGLTGSHLATGLRTGAPQTSLVASPSSAAAVNPAGHQTQTVEPPLAPDK